MDARLPLLVLTSCALLRAAAASDNCYDHQTETYHARITPAGCSKTCTVTPFFSPDTSILTYVTLIEAAEESIDIYTPGQFHPAIEKLHRVKFTEIACKCMEGKHYYVQSRYSL